MLPAGVSADDCATPEFATPCAEFNQTSTALAATYAGTSVPSPTRTPTPVDFDLLTTPTVENSRECPSEPFSTEDLDPQWALVCSPCLPEAVADTPTPGGIMPLPSLPSFSIPTINFSTFTPVPLTATPTSVVPTPTSTYTPTVTSTPDFGWEHFIDFTLSDGDFTGSSRADICTANPDWYSVYFGFVGWGGNLNGSTYSVCHWREFSDINLFPGVTNITYYWDGYGGSQGWDNLAMQLWYEGDLIVTGNTGLINAEGSSNSIVNINDGDGVWFDMITISGASATDNPLRNTGIYMAGIGCDPFNGECSGNTPTPSPTPTATTTPGTPTPTLDPFAVPTQDRSIIGFIIIDCRQPKYVDRSRAVDVDVTPQSGDCYTLLPGNEATTFLTLDVPATPKVDLCLQFYQVTFQMMGVVVDIPLLVTVAFALLVVRWALFGG